LFQFRPQAFGIIGLHDLGFLRRAFLGIDTKRFASGIVSFAPQRAPEKVGSKQRSDVRCQRRGRDQSNRAFFNGMDPAQTFLKSASFSADLHGDFTA